MIREAWSRTARDAVYGIAISKNGEYIVTGSWDKTIACYDRLGKILWSYKSGGQVWGTDICDDGSYVIGGSTDKNVYCFKWKEKIFARYRVGSPIWSVAISSDGRYIVAGAEDGNVYFFERGSGKLFWSAATKNAVYGVGISSDGRYVVAGSGDTNVYCYGFGKELWKYTTNGLVWGIGISRIGNYVVAGSEDGWIYCFDIKGRILWRHFLEERPWGVRISDRGEFVVVGSERGYIYCLKGKNGQLLWKFDTKSPSNPVYSVAVSGNGEYIVACSKKESIFFFENLGPASKHAIERVKSLIRVGSGTDFDLSDAKKIIEKAEEAFARNDYALALDLAKNAENYTKEIPKYHVLDRKLVQNWLFSLGVVEKAAEASPDLIRIVGPLYIKTEEISSDRTVGEKIVGYEEKVETFKNILKNYEKIALKERMGSEALNTYLNIKSGIETITNTIQELKSIQKEKEKNALEIEERTKLIVTDWLSGKRADVEALSRKIMDDADERVRRINEVVSEVLEKTTKTLGGLESDVGIDTEFREMILESSPPPPKPKEEGYFLERGASSEITVKDSELQSLWWDEEKKKPELEPKREERRRERRLVGKEADLDRDAGVIELPSITLHKKRRKK